MCYEISSYHTLRIIFNRSLSSSVFPNCFFHLSFFFQQMNSSFVVIIFKIGQRYQIIHYRPIRFLSVTPNSFFIVTCRFISKTSSLMNSSNFIFKGLPSRGFPHICYTVPSHFPPSAFWMPKLCTVYEDITFTLFSISF